LDRDRLSLMLTAVGLTIVKERLKTGGKLAYFLARRTDDGDMRLLHSALPQELTTKVSLRGGASRNNFSILL
jgi:25S rRNA (adenine(2142)-N(1))-methyltransferase, Bmt2